MKSEDNSSDNWMVVIEPPWSPPLPTLQGPAVKTANDYLEGEGETLSEKLSVINLCRSYQYLSKGYYVSLVADARRQRVLPTLEMIEGVNNPFWYLRTLQEAGVKVIDFKVVEGRRRLLPKVVVLEGGDGKGNGSTLVGRAGEDKGPSRLERAGSGYVELTAVFGRTRDPRFHQHAMAVYRLFSFPLLKIRMYEGDGVWKVGQIQPLSPQQATPEELQFLAEQLARGKFLLPPPPVAGPKPHRIACLWDPDEPLSPSDGETIDRFTKVAAGRGVLFERITRRDLSRLSEYDALFIRTVTAVDHYSYTFAQMAESFGIPVIDDPSSILKCSNKIFLYELFRKHGIPIPATAVISRKSYKEDVAPLGFPVILKVPDGTFSQAVKMARDPAELDALTKEMFKRSPLLIAQRFMPTPFDWRVGILAGEILWVARYHMARDHWQIARRLPGGATRYGKVEAVPVAEAPRQVCELALAGAALIGDGLYGVDIKETDDGPVIIEINDNPNLETDLEDAADRNRPYEAIIDAFLAQIEAGSRVARLV